MVANFERPFDVGDEIEDKESRVPARDLVALVAVRDTGQLDPQRRCGSPGQWIISSPMRIFYMFLHLSCIAGYFCRKKI